MDEQSPTSTGPSKRLKRSKLWAGLGGAIAALAGFILNADELHVAIAFWVLAVLLFIIRSALDREIRKQRREQPCERCGHRGDTEPFLGREPYTFDAPRNLCFECRWAHMDFFDNLDLYKGFDLLGPDSPLDYSPIDTALLDLGKDDLDRARRVLTEESWQEWKAWLVDHFGKHSPEEIRDDS